MPITRRLFTQAIASALAFPSLPCSAQTSLTFAIGRLPQAYHITRVVSAGAPADILLLAVAPEKLVGFSSFDFARQVVISLPETIRHLPKLGKLAGRASTLSLERLLALKPDLVVDCGNTDESWLSQARQVNKQTLIPWLLINGELKQTPEQLRVAGKVFGYEERTELQAELARYFIDGAVNFSQTAAAKVRFYAARGARGLETGLQGSLHTEAAELLGLQNVAHIPGRHGLSPVSMENILDWQPDIILVQDAVTAQYLQQAPVWQGVKAVANKRILFLSGLPFGWLDAPPGINRLLGLRRLHAWLDPAIRQHFKEDMRLYSHLFWHTPLSDSDYQKRGVNT